VVERPREDRAVYRVTRPLSMLLESRAIYAATEKAGPKASVTGWEDTL